MLLNGNECGKSENKDNLQQTITCANSDKSYITE
jgi:hypothetical protein